MKKTQQSRRNFVRVSVFLQCWRSLLRAGHLSRRLACCSVSWLHTWWWCSVVPDPIIYGPWSVLFRRGKRCDLCSQDTLAGRTSGLALALPGVPRSCASLVRFEMNTPGGSSQSPGRASTSNPAPVPAVFSGGLWSPVLVRNAQCEPKQSHPSNCRSRWSPQATYDVQHGSPQLSSLQGYR